MTCTNGPHSTQTKETNRYSEQLCISTSNVLQLSFNSIFSIRPINISWGAKKDQHLHFLLLYLVLTFYKLRTVWRTRNSLELILSDSLTRLTWLVHTSFLPSSWNLNKKFALTAKLAKKFRFSYRQKHEL